MTHFYTETENGIEPRHFVPMAKDPTRTRASRVTDAKKAAKNGELWLASVTTVLNILDKPALVNWKVDQHLQQAWNIERAPEESLDDYKKRVKSATREELDKAPKAGTDVHKMLELWMEGVDPESEADLLICENVGKALAENTGETCWTCEKYFLNKNHYYAGCADLISDDWIIDYKTKQEAAKFKPGKMQYTDHKRQLAAYRGDNGKRCANLFICIETGEVDFQEVSEPDLNNAYLDFLDCLSIYRRNHYDPLG